MSLLIHRNRGGRVGGTERTTACYGVSRNSSPLVLWYNLSTKFLGAGNLRQLNRWHIYTQPWNTFCLTDWQFDCTVGCGTWPTYCVTDYYPHNCNAHCDWCNVQVSKAQTTISRRLAGHRMDPPWHTFMYAQSDRQSENIMPPSHQYNGQRHNNDKWWK